MRTPHFGLRVRDLDRSLAFYTAVGYEVIGRVPEATFTELVARGIDAEAPTSPDGSDDFLTTFIVDPDGNRIELVQWPAGHADGMSAADWAE